MHPYNHGGGCIRLEFESSGQFGNDTPIFQRRYSLAGCRVEINSGKRLIMHSASIGRFLKNAGFKVDCVSFPVRISGHLIFISWIGHSLGISKTCYR